MLSRPHETNEGRSSAMPTPLSNNGQVTYAPSGLSNFLAVDIRSPFFTNNSGINNADLAKIYMQVFNGIKEVSAKWDSRSARNLVDVHTRTIGCNLALFDLGKNKIIGGFLSTIIPCATGWKLSSQDLFVESRYQKSGIGGDLYFRALSYADDICASELKSNIVADTSTTYKIPEFPKKMWERKGYALRSLFGLTAHDILQHEATRDVAASIEHAHAADILDIASFIANNNTISSDGEKWSRPQAIAYTKFMLENHPATFVTTKIGGNIVAVSSLNIMPGRLGPNGVEVQCFVTRCNDEASRIKIVQTSFNNLLRYAKGAAMQIWGQEFSAVEIPQSSAAFFQPVFPHMREDAEFLSVEGLSPDHLKNEFNPALKSRINLIPHIPAKKLER